MALRKLSPGGYEYLTGAVACADRELEPGESLADYYFAHGYPPGEWFGEGARALGVSGQATQAQMTALFGEGRHPDADVIEARMILHQDATAAQAMTATKLGSSFSSYGGWDDLRSAAIEAYKAHNIANGRLWNAPIDEATRATIRSQVRRQKFTKAHGRAPQDAKELTSWLAEQKRQLKTAVAGYEMVFAPPKSVSVAWALSDEPTQRLIASLHRQAVRDALTYFESNAVFTRQGNGGTAQVDANGITAVMFEHWDSRTGDPHLHTHVPISNKVKRATDGRWTSLDGRTVFASTVTVSEFYNSRLRDLFTERGASWTEKPTGGVDSKRPVWELDGVPQLLLERFSGRTLQVEADRAERIVAFRQEHGREPNAKELLELGKRAQYASRAGKQAPRSLREHMTEWRTVAINSVGAKAVENLPRRLFGQPTDTAAGIDVVAVARSTLRAVDEHHSHFNRWNIEAEAHRQTAHLRLTPAQRDRTIAAVMDAVVKSEGCVSLQPPAQVAEPKLLRRRNGESVFTPHNSTRYTTTRTLRAEHDIVRFARQTGGHLVPEPHLRAALADARLNTGQRELVRSFATSGRRVQLALAPAGAGKTTAMRTFADAWRSAGGRVIAFAPSARAAQELGDSIGAQPHTLHQLTTALDVGRAKRAFYLRRGDILIVDEAAMAGTHTLHRVIAYALDRGADVRLVGDDGQLGAVEAGGAVRLIAHDVGATRLDEIVRFSDPSQASASLLIRAGDPAGLTYYVQHGWVQGGSRETMRDAALAAWRTDLNAGQHSLLIVPTREDVITLNTQAHRQRERSGQLHGPVVALHDGTHARTNDLVVTRKNQRQLSVLDGSDFVKNGDTWQVDTVHVDGSVAVTNRANHAQIVLPPDYASTHLELAYAATVHRVQGMTADSSHTLTPDSLTREQLYTATTRGRDTNRLYVVTHQHVADQHQETPPDRTAHDVLTSIVRRSGVESSATEALRAGLRDSESLAELVRRHNYAARHGDTDRYLDALHRYAPATVHQPAEAALIQTLRNAFDLGWPTDQLLTHRYLTDDIEAGKDPAALLAWRIDQYIANNTSPEPATAQLPERGDGRAPALPWMARVDFDSVDQHEGLRGYLRDVNEAIATRTQALADDVARERPGWARSLGPRPTRAADAALWDRRAGMAAAYRESHNITSNDPDRPLGPKPDGTGVSAHAWRQVIDAWTSRRDSGQSLDTEHHASGDNRRPSADRWRGYEDSYSDDYYGYSQDTTSDLGSHRGLGY